MTDKVECDALCDQMGRNVSRETFCDTSTLSGKRAGGAYCPARGRRWSDSARSTLLRGLAQSRVASRMPWRDHRKNAVEFLRIVVADVNGSTAVGFGQHDDFGAEVVP